ncbi:MAG: P-loop NTPase [bacterium]
MARDPVSGMEVMNQKQVEERKRIEERMAKIKYKIMVLSNKGGVGKTTVAVNLATGFTLQGFRVGLMDADFHGPNIPKMLGLSGKRMVLNNGGMVPISLSLDNGLLKVVSLAFLAEKDSAVIWRGMLKMSVINQFLADVQWGELDYLIVDMPPGTSDEPLSVAQLVPGARAVIVTTAQEVALLDSRKAVDFARKLSVPVTGIVENMSGLLCPHCYQEIELFGKGGGQRAARELGVPFLGRIPLEPAIVRSGDDGKPFIRENVGKKEIAPFLEILKKIGAGMNADDERLE